MYKQLHQLMFSKLLPCRCFTADEYSEDESQEHLWPDSASCMSSQRVSYHVTIHVGEVSGLNVQVVDCEYETPNCRCPASADVCEFELEIEARMTFTRYRVDEEINEKGVAGTIYYFNETTGDLLPHPLSDQVCVGN